MPAHPARSRTCRRGVLTRVRAFTLIELIVVVVIIGVLAGVAAVAYAGNVKHSRETSVLASATALGNEVAALSATADQVPGPQHVAASAVKSSGSLTVGPVVAGTVNLTLNSTSACLRLGTQPGAAGTATLGQCAVAPAAPVLAAVLNGMTGNVSWSAPTWATSYSLTRTTTKWAAAKFNSPDGVAVDSAGTFYVADQSNNRIRKISPAGVVSTLAGSGTSGFADGPGASAMFNNPLGVAVDSAGNVYVGDLGNQRIRKISPAGVVSTLAGSGTAGFADGPGAAAQFNGPRALAVDSAGTVYVPDFNNHRIRKISSAGVVSTLAGSGTGGFADGTGAAAQFYYPAGLVVDGAGTLYVADKYNYRIRKISSAGVVSTLAGSGTAGFADGTGTAAQFNAPNGVAVDSAGIVYVADGANNRIRKISPAGVVSTLAGSGTSGFADGTGAAAMFDTPYGLAVDGAGTLYVGDTGNNRIRRVSTAGVVSTLAGSSSAGFADTAEVPTGTGTAYTGSATSYADTLTPGVRYYYTVTASNSAGTSGPSNTAGPLAP